MIHPEKVNFKNLSWILILSFAIYAVFYIYFGEKVPINNGFGWDGAIYGNGVKDFAAKLINKEFQNLHVERLLPSAILYYVFSIFQIEFSDQNIITGFAYFNLVLFLGSIALWRKLATLVKFSGRMEFLGLLTIILSFPLLKFIPYYPVLTDAPAMFIGFLTLYGFVADKKLYVCMAFFLACFTWAMAALVIPILLIFKKEQRFELWEKRRLNQWLIASGIIVLDIFMYYFFVISNNMNDGYPAFRRMAAENHIGLSLIVGTIGMNLYLVASFGFVAGINIWKNIKIFLLAIRIPFLLFFVAALISVKMFVGTFPQAEYIKMSWYVIDLFTTQSLQPFSNIISMVLYFGPIVYLAVFKYKAIIEQSRLMGSGFMLFFTANLIQCMDAESRHLIFFFPFMIFLVAVSYKNEKISGQFLAGFALLALVCSKVWFTINTPEFLYAILNEEVYTNEAQQRYFMHHGLFMSYKYFLIQAGIVAVAGVLFYVFIQKTMKATADSHSIPKPLI